MDAQETERAVQGAAQRLVRQEIVCCVSSLVYSMTQHVDEMGREFQQDLGFGYDEAAHLWERAPDADDYRDAVPSGVDVSVEEEEGGWNYLIAYEGDDPDDAQRAGGFDSEIEAYREAFDAMREDQPSGGEIYEHWIVSDWLAGKLEARGETVARDVLGGMTIWARPTTGQAIAMDAVIQTIAAVYFMESADA
jgi:hypothetical protein